MAIKERYGHRPKRYNDDKPEIFDDVKTTKALTAFHELNIIEQSFFILEMKKYVHKKPRKNAT